MVAIYRQQPVTVVRTARAGDPAFDENCATEQVLIKHADGSQTAVPKDQVAEEPAPKAEAPKAEVNIPPKMPQNPNQKMR